MRNYIRALSARGHIHFFSDEDPPNPPIEFEYDMTFFGQFPGDAEFAAAVTCDNIIAQDPAHYSGFVVSNPPINVLLNYGFVTSLLIFPTEGDQPAGGQRGQVLFENLVSNCEQLGIDPFISPKEQDAYPWNGRAIKHLFCNIDRHV